MASVARQTSSSYSNIDATGEPEDRSGVKNSLVRRLFGQCVSVDQSVWFKIQVPKEYILSPTKMTANCAAKAFYSNDTQMALYKGSCDVLLN